MSGCLGNDRNTISLCFTLQLQPGNLDNQEDEPCHEASFWSTEKTCQHWRPPLHLAHSYFSTWFLGFPPSVVISPSCFFGIVLFSSSSTFFSWVGHSPDALHFASAISPNALCSHLCSPVSYGSDLPINQKNPPGTKLLNASPPSLQASP